MNSIMGHVRVNIYEYIPIFTDRALKLLKCFEFGRVRIIGKLSESICWGSYSMFGHNDLINIQSESL